MELRNSRHSSDAITPELGQLLPLGGVDIDEAVHVADAEPVDVVPRVELPLRSETFIRFRVNLHHQQ